MAAEEELRRREVKWSALPDPRHTQSQSGTVTVVQSSAWWRDWDCSPPPEGGTAVGLGLQCLAEGRDCS